MPMY